MVDFQFVFHLFDAERAAHQPGAVLALNHLRLARFALGGQFADDRLEDIGGGDHAGDAPEFVGHDRQMLPVSLNRSSACRASRSPE